ncbi:hypothetical protein [uncultured Campylobacter sp.]|uniref:hypothetical protein n=1 Tax=uncultured Campylobacter sp. TaxID=218934 RepID=UPI002635A43A|nr:hypothetical protein [uncultured Campylobacter sp.]
MIPFAAHKETIDLAMQNGINLVALLLCDNDLIKRTVSARVKFTASGARQFIKFYAFYASLKFLNTKEFRLNSQRNFIACLMFKELA